MGGKVDRSSPNVVWEERERSHWYLQMPTPHVELRTVTGHVRSIEGRHDKLIGERERGGRGGEEGEGEGEGEGEREGEGEGEGGRERERPRLHEQLKNPFRAKYFDKQKVRKL